MGAQRRPPRLDPVRELDAIRFRVGAQEYALLRISVPEPTLPSTLTATERRVAELLLSGVRPAAIAELRASSLHTVRNQIRSIYRKIGVGSRAELLAACGGLRESDTGD